MNHQEFKLKSQEMFDSQFPNTIKMSMPRSDFMGIYEKNIKNELKEWIDVTIDKYQELVKTPNLTNEEVK